MESDSPKAAAISFTAVIEFTLVVHTKYLFADETVISVEVGELYQLCRPLLDSWPRTGCEIRLNTATEIVTTGGAPSLFVDGDSVRTLCTCIKSVSVGDCDRSDGHSGDTNHRGSLRSQPRYRLEVKK